MLIVSAGWPSSCTSVSCVIPRTCSITVLDVLPRSSRTCEIGAEDLHVEGALETGLRLVDRVFRRLRVVERDPREDRRASCSTASMNAGLACGTVPVHVVVRLQADVELGIEEAGRVGAVIGAAVLVGDDRDFGKASAGSSGSAARCGDDSSNEIV